MRTELDHAARAQFAARERACDDRRRAGDAVEADARAHGREFAAQGGALVPAEARFRHQQAGRARDPAAHRRAASATMPGITASSWSAAGRRATSSRARSRCRRRCSRAPTGGVAARPVVVTLPDERPELAPALKLKFKYYQRLEGTIPVPPGRPGQVGDGTRLRGGPVESQGHPDACDPVRRTPCSSARSTRRRKSGSTA